MRFILVILCCVSFLNYAQEGTVIGQVVDEKGNPLIGASIIYRGDVTLGASTDIEGNYKLKLPVGNRKIICRFTDMVTDTFTVVVLENQFVEHNISMKRYGSVTEFEEVEVRVGKFDKRPEDITVSLEIIKPELIESKNTRSIETILDQTPGLNIMDGEPQIRGGSGFTFGVGSKVAVIVDDMPLLSGDAGRPEWGFVPVENIHQVEVTKGASSVLSGSSALSGSIHIRTAYPTSEPLTKVNLYSGLYMKPSIEGATWWDNTPLIAGANFLHSRILGNWDIVVGGNLNYDHGYMGPPVQDPLVEEHSPDTLSNFSESQMVAKRARVNFNLRHRSKKLKGLSYGVNGNFMISESPMVLAWLNDSTGLYRGYPGATFLQNQLIFNIDPFVNFITSTEGKHFLRTRLIHADNKMTANQDSKFTTYYADYMFQKEIAKLRGVDFIAGITGKYTSSYAEMYVGSGTADNDLLNVSGYAQIEKKVLNLINLSVGGRLEYSHMHDTITELKPIFRAGASINVFKETYFRASFGQGYRFPTITERFIRTGVGNFGVFANPDLKSESSWNAEFGIKQGLKLGRIYGYFDVAAYWQEYQNTIEYLFGVWGNSFTSLSDTWGFKFINTGESRVLGLDMSFSGKAKLSEKAEMVFMLGYNYILPTSLSPNYVYAVDSVFMHKEYSYNSTSLDNSRNILKYRFLHNVKADVEVNFFDRYSVGVSAKYFSKMENMDAVIEEFEYATSAPLIQNIRYMDYFRENQKGVWIVDLRVSFAFNKQHKVSLVASNLLNNSYSLRPLKIESPRTLMFQYTLKLQD